MDVIKREEVKEKVPILLDNLNGKEGVKPSVIVKQLQITLPTVISYNYKSELESINKGLLIFLKREITVGSYSPFIGVCKLINQYKRAFPKQDRDAIYSLAAKRFDYDVEVFKNSAEKRLYNVWELGQLLALYYCKNNRFKEADSCLNVLIDCVESSDPYMPALRKASLYYDLIKCIGGYGRSEVKERINKILQNNAQHIGEDFSSVGTQFSIPLEVIDQVINQLTEGCSDGQALASFALHFVPSEKQYREFSDAINQSGTLLGLFKHLYFRKDGYLSHVIEPCEGQDAQKEIQSCSTMLQHMSAVLHAFIMRWQETGSLNADMVMNHIATAKGLSAKRISIIEKGISAFFEDDYITSISILLPQIEFMVRTLFQLQGYVVTDNDKTGATSDALGTLLENKTLVINGRDIIKFLQLILSWKTAWNIRNLYCHGLEDAFNEPHADRVFHIVVLLATLLSLVEEDQCNCN